MWREVPISRGLIEQVSLYKQTDAGTHLTYFSSNLNSIFQVTQEMSKEKNNGVHTSYVTTFTAISRLYQLRYNIHGRQSFS